MPQYDLSCTINQRAVQCRVDPRASLMDVLRDEGYMSVKHGCGVGECGACTVLIDDAPIDACLYLAIWAEGKHIRTAEGEGVDNKASLVQQAYAEAGAVQCGFCTPGLIMSSTAFVEQHKGQAAAREVSRDAIRHAHAGNLCRCTGYDTIINAVENALKK